MTDHQPDERLHTPFDFFIIVRCTEQIAEEDGTKEEIYEICFFPRNGQRKRKIGNMKGAPGWPSFMTFLVSAYATLSLAGRKVLYGPSRFIIPRKLEKVIQCIAHVQAGFVRFLSLFMLFFG